MTIVDVIGHRPGNTLVLKGKSSRMGVDNTVGTQIQRFDEGFNSADIVDLKPAADQHSLRVEFCFESNAQIYLFASFANPAAGRKTLYMQKLHSMTLMPIDAPQNVFELIGEPKRNPGYFNYAFSRDSSKILIGLILIARITSI